MSPVIINIYDDVLDYELNQPGGMVGRRMHLIAQRMELGAKAQVGVRTGALRASIHSRQERWARGQLVEVSAEMSYAYMHHEGTAPHLITGHGGRNLRFMSRGKVVYTKVVHHPGTRSNKFLSDQLRYVND
jgi:hypothetical protein